MVCLLIISHVQCLKVYTHYLDTEAASTPPEEELHLFAIGAPTTKSSSIKCSVVAEGITLDMEVDTGAEVSVISYYNKRNSHFDVQELLFQFWTERRETWQEYGEA